jgi:hypothetical protein
MLEIMYLSLLGCSVLIIMLVFPHFHYELLCLLDQNKELSAAVAIQHEVTFSRPYPTSGVARVSNSPAFDSV